MFSLDDYKWNLNPRFIRIASADSTFVHTMSDKEAENKKKKKGVKILDGSNIMQDSSLMKF